MSFISINKLEANGYKGPDVSLEISLFEYGIAWRQGDDHADDEYTFLCRVKGDANTRDINSEFVAIKHSSEELEEQMEESWFDVCRFFEFADYKSDIETYIANEFPRCMQDVIHYHGHANILGEHIPGNRIIIIKDIPETFGDFLEDEDIPKEAFLKAFYIENPSTSLSDIDKTPIDNNLMFDVPWERFDKPYETMEDLANLWATYVSIDNEIPLGIEIV
jgi:hypothetical protein